MLFTFRLLAAALAVMAKSGALDPEPPFKAIAQMSGADSAIEISRVVAITSQADWARIWSENHASFQVGVQTAGQVADPDLPKVDFEKQAVLCMFGGQSKNVGAFRVTDSGSEGKLAYVRIEPTLLPQTGTEILQNPYIFVTVPKTRRSIVVQIDDGPLGGERWRTLATLGPTKN